MRDVNKAIKNIKELSENYGFYAYSYQIGEIYISEASQLGDLDKDDVTVFAVDIKDLDLDDYNNLQEILTTNNDGFENYTHVLKVCYQNTVEDCTLLILSWDN